MADNSWSHLSSLVFGAQGLRSIDIWLLPALGSTTEQHNQRFAILR
jgi:hypothetical protein